MDSIEEKGGTAGRELPTKKTKIGKDNLLLKCERDTTLGEQTIGTGPEAFRTEAWHLSNPQPVQNGGAQTS